jgi:hypothetical protein
MAMGGRSLPVAMMRKSIENIGSGAHYFPYDAVFK